MVQKHGKVYHKHRLLFLPSWQATSPFVFSATHLLSYFQSSVYPHLGEKEMEETTVLTVPYLSCGVDWWDDRKGPMISLLSPFLSWVHGTIPRPVLLLPT